ncbi:MAG TPA: 2TM domain-containing protein [Frankiaceae bacterium]|nr:2TM domain-containing protein [Frankiaceae bacterium]
MVRTSPHGFFWPVFLIAFWGVGLVMNAWDVHRPDPFSEEQVRAEIGRLQGRQRGQGPQS